MEKQRENAAENITFFFVQKRSCCFSLFYTSLPSKHT